MANQQKGLGAIVWGGLQFKNLAEDSVTFDIGELGDTVSASDTLVHVRKNPSTVISSMTVNVVKNAPGMNAFLALILAGIPLPLTANDPGTGIKIFMPSANATQVAIGDASGAVDAETNSFTFKGNLQIVSLEG